MLVEIENGRGNVLLETIYPDGGIWKEKHDAEGCLVTEEKPDQNVVHTVYDSMDRILKQTDTDGNTDPVSDNKEDI